MGRMCGEEVFHRVCRRACHPWQPHVSTCHSILVLRCAGEEFFTDANALTIVRRVRGVRAAFAAQTAAPGPDPELAIPLAGNYFPITSAVFVRDAAAGRELSLVTDRGQGVLVSAPISTNQPR
jgi:hypothetical protein